MRYLAARYRFAWLYRQLADLERRCLRLVEMDPPPLILEVPDAR